LSGEYVKRFEYEKERISRINKKWHGEFKYYYFYLSIIFISEQ
jgi:hypothetical protein